MDYVVGGVAALISGNVTPNRPKHVRRALTPIKHQPSPNVTPKSELVDDRSIFLSPSVQKKKAIVKKSPKRIFQNPDLDVTCDGENKPSSPKANKVKKHLQEDLEEDSHNNTSMAKSPRKNKNKTDKSFEVSITEQTSPQSANESTPKKKKRKSTSDDNETVEKANITPKRKKTQPDEQENTEKPINISNKSASLEDSKALDTPENDKKQSPKKKKNKSKIQNVNSKLEIEKQSQDNTSIENKSKKSNKKNKSVVNQNDRKSDNESAVNDESATTVIENKSNKKKNKSKKKKDENPNYINPNAITNEDTDSEHESDDEIVSENEEANKEILDTRPADESSDEETEETKKIEPKEKLVEVRTEDEIKRTIFVGNVPFTKKCKKEIKKIFSKYGAIETVRIRTVPVKDARVTPKLAVIKQELHPERTTVNIYVKFKDASSIEQALSENNTVLDGCHLRVSRSDTTGAEHDPRNAIFVGNVPFALEDDALRDKFDKCGEIVSVRIIRDKRTGAGKGFGYVNFASKDGVELALALSEEDLTIKNRILRVKRCTQSTQNQDGKKNFKNQGMQGKNHGLQGRNQGMQGRNQGMQGRSQGMQRRNQGMQGRSQGMQRRNQGMQGKKFDGKGPKQWGQKQEGMGEGAQRRLMNKRKNQDDGAGPDAKMPKHLNQSQKEKKSRKEFVGMTAEKKKKHTFNKGQKKKKALSEILTK